MDRQPVVYMLASSRAGTLYTGVTSDLVKRLYEHLTKIVPGFTARYDINRLVWYEVHPTMETAILRERRVKKWNRDWELNLIEHDNPGWLDLALGFGFEPVRRHENGSPPARG